MSTDLETELRREFDAVGAPGGLTFSPESVLRQGNRTIRRHRLVAAGSAAIAVSLMAVGANLVRPHDTAAPLPASHTATTGIAKAQAGFIWGQVQVEFDRDVRVQPNVRFSAVAQDGRRHEVGTSSTGKPGEKPDAVWRSGIVGGHPVTIGLVPSPARNMAVTFADGGSYAVGSEELAGTGYVMFYVDYTGPDGGPKEPPRPSEIASIRWTGATGIVDGIEGDSRLIGRTLTLGKGVSVDVVLRPPRCCAPGDSGETTVFGMTHLQDAGTGSGFELSVATTDPSGAAVVTGRQPNHRPTANGLVNVLRNGPPVAAGILPPGASDLVVILTKGYAPVPIVVSEVMPDGGVIFAITAGGTPSTDPSTDSIKAVTWTNADGTQGRIDVTQKQG